jgi:hypothetical protein
MPEIPLLSFFAGAGFLDIGFMQAGFEIIWRNENNLSFVKGFEYALSQMPEFNHNGNGRVHTTSSITELKANQIEREAFNNLPRPEIFGVIGGPPCPGSHALYITLAYSATVSESLWFAMCHGIPAEEKSKRAGSQRIFNRYLVRRIYDTKFTAGSYQYSQRA